VQKIKVENRISTYISKVNVEDRNCISGDFFHTCSVPLTQTFFIYQFNHTSTSVILHCYLLLLLLLTSVQTAYFQDLLRVWLGHIPKSELEELPQQTILHTLESIRTERILFLKRTCIF